MYARLRSKEAPHETISHCIGTGGQPGGSHDSHADRRACSAAQGLGLGVGAFAIGALVGAALARPYYARSYYYYPGYYGYAYPAYGYAYPAYSYGYYGGYYGGPYCYGGSWRGPAGYY